ncbi:imelysin family protein [Ottowia testudinis]|uniref:Imelysin family protein n=2 Tax=Ottowia testudinis TaxID=2816950 RepID=A0A975H5E1_9BURK|nr:imelysin family protein [Ottowia testudinis]
MPLAMAQPAPSVAVPFYTPLDMAQGLRQHWSPPLAARFAASAQALPTAVQALCDAPAAQAAPRLQDARAAWVQAVQDWDRYASVPLAALIERRALRQLDFMPPRPALIRRAVAQAPSGAAGMERVGTPAKGLPALEWLLWQASLAPATPECAYAVQVAADIGREAVQLNTAADAAASAEPTPEQSSAAFAELLNQWVGSVERLRWAHIDKPRREAASGAKSEPPHWPRAASGHTAGSWRAHWQALKQLAVMSGAAPAPGQGVVTLEAYLRGRGLIALADRWADRIAATDQTMQAIDPRQGATLDKAVKALAQTKRMAEDEVASALDVRMGFSDADGD